jgi:AbrB family transcriptional regulator (stage V sporulation protein T)
MHKIFFFSNTIFELKNVKGGSNTLKATGVVRRIDDLGRIVIPKEIRRTLHIKEGDPLEIFTDKEGEVILKKYSPIGELSEFATGYAETLSKTTGHIACITDKDTVIAVSGGSKKEFLEKSLSPELEKVMENKEIYTSKENNELSLPITQNDNNERRYNSQVIYPIISDGDVIGSVILLSKEQNTKMGDTELKVVQSAAGFLSSQMNV